MSSSPATRSSAPTVSATQWRIWFDAQSLRDPAAYNVAVAYRVPAALDRDVLQQALEAEIASHAELACVFRIERGALIKVRRAEPIRVARIAAPGTDRATRDAAALDAAQRFADLPFDPAHDALVRAAIIDAGGDSILVLSCHHLVCDGESFGVLVRGVSRRISERDLVPAPPEHVYETTAAPAEPMPARAHPRAAFPRAARLPADAEPGAAPGGAMLTIPVAAASRDALVQAARRHRVSAFAIATAAFALVLRAFDDGDAPVVVSFPVSSRRFAAADTAVGPFLTYRTIALEARAATPLGAFVADVWSAIRSAIVDDGDAANALLAPGRRDYRAYSLAYVPLQETTPLGGVRATRVHLDAHAAKFDLTLGLIDVEGRLEIVAQFATAVYTRVAIAGFAALLLRAIAALEAHGEDVAVGAAASALRVNEVEQLARPANRDEVLFVERDPQPALGDEQKLDGTE